MNDDKMQKLIALMKRRGFVYPGSEIYGGLANTYDYGPLGTELLRNIRNAWWIYFVQNRSDVVGLDASMISHHKIWEASGHVAGFADAMVDCKNCKLRKRADHLIEEYFQTSGKTMSVEGLSEIELDEVIAKNNIPCPNCNKFEWTKVRKFNLLFPIKLGIVEGDEGMGYLRGETAQGVFINFKNIVDSTRVRLPFGVAQVGRSFRNEVTAGNSIFRTIEFEQAELEYFFDPEKNDWEELFEEWKLQLWKFVTQDLGIKAENLRWRSHTDEERSFYSKRTEDLEYRYPFGGFKELWGLAYRTDYDLNQHQKFSGKDLLIIDPESNKPILPHVIEPAVGINRLALMVLADAYEEKEEKVVLRLNPKIAPYKVAVFPLVANKEDLIRKAREVYDKLKPNFMTAWDDRGNIGKRYATQDEAGTPWCVTVDYTSLEDDTVTVRERDTGRQVRVLTEELVGHFRDRLL